MSTMIVPPVSGAKVIKFTADGSSEPPAPTPEEPAVDEEDAFNDSDPMDPLSWDGGDRYLYWGEGTGSPVRRIDLSSGVVVTNITNTSNFNNSAQNFVQPDIVSVQVTSGGNRRLSMVNVATATVASTIDLPNPTDGAGPITIAVVTPPDDSGKVYAITMTLDGSAGAVWSSDVAADGTASAFASLGALSASSGGLLAHQNMTDPTMISDRIGIAGNTRTMWDAQNPLVLHPISLPADAEINPSLDFFDQYLGGSSGGFLYPQHILMGRRSDAGGTIGKIVELEFSADGTSCTISRSWTIPGGGQPLSMTYAKKTSGEVVAVAIVVRSGVRHLYEDIFGTPTEITIAVPGDTFNPTMALLAPANDGYLIAATNTTGWHKWVHHIFGAAATEGGPLSQTELILLGPSTAEQGDSEKHQGRFAIDQNTNQYSAWFRVGTTDADIWVVPVVSFFQIDPGGSSVVGLGQQSLPAVGVTAAPQWRDVNIYGKTPAGATHYTITAKMFSDSGLSQPLAEGTRVFFDAIFVPESGYDLRDGTQPYLDGDQSFGIWEGTEKNSTSVYGTKPVKDLSQIIILDVDLPVYDASVPDSPPTPPEE